MRYWILATLFFISSSIFSQEVENQFYVGNQSYEIGQYAVAIEQYESIRSNGYESAELYYNLGNAYYKFGELGNAILNYERAAQLSPDNPDIRHNLEIAQQEVALKLDKLPTFFLTQIRSDLRQMFSSNIWAVVFLLLLWLSMSALILWQVGNKRTYRKWGFLTAVVLLIFTILGFALALDSYNKNQHSGQAIVLEKEVALRKAADAASPETLLLKEGIKVKLLNNVIQNWHKVRLSNGQEGWLQEDAMEEI